jgi:DNA-binding IclR family transcriptional regulator
MDRLAMTEQAPPVNALQSNLKHVSTPPSWRAGIAGIGVIDSGFLLLESLRILGRARVSELTKESGLPRTTVYRLLCQLAAVGAVERVGAHYRLGASLLALGRHVTPMEQLRTLARRPMIELAAATPAHVNLCTTAGHASVYLDVYCGPDRLPFRQMAGEPIPARLASARVLTTNVDFAVDDGRTTDGVSSAAKAIPLPNGQMAAVGIAVALPHVPHALIARLLTTANRINALLGAQSPPSHHINRQRLGFAP